MRSRIAGVLLVLSGLAVPAAAQFETATVLGSVRDKSGALVPGASVVLLNLGTGQTQTQITDATGTYEFFTVRIGTYKVTAELSGFTTAAADEVKVAVGSR